MRQGLLRTLANRMRGQNHRSRSERRNRSTRAGFDIFSIPFFKLPFFCSCSGRKISLETKTRITMALFNNTFKAAVLFAAITFALYGSAPVHTAEAAQKYAEKYPKTRTRASSR